MHLTEVDVFITIVNNLSTIKKYKKSSGEKLFAQDVYPQVLNDTLPLLYSQHA